MEYIDSLKIINGEEFLNYCISIGANIETKNYN